ncbi:MptD family putative ECF transporter S component [Fannyhessea vaginae]|uniref:MptD family putative ECF transporter S component n=1 Tax=Fannyhessea vaginae TaxID=82135 RepID=UPI0028899124|nr:MptD family putative ECF transporter S component [Fannyhessea vaginae]
MERATKLSGHDLINIGIFGAIYFVIVCVISMLGIVPVFLPLLAVLMPIIGGIPFMLFLTKVKKPGMIFIMAIIMGLLMVLTGMGMWSLLTSAIAGLIAEIVFKSGNYASAKKAVLTYGFFSLWMYGNYMSLFLDREQYFAQRASFGKAYAEAVAQLLPNWMAFVLLIVCFICGILGGLLGQKVLKKHFEKAGLV